MRISTFFKPLSFIPAFLMMYVIFSFSAQDAEVSSSLSYKASTIIVETADQVFDMELDDNQVSYFATKIHGPTRKLAHMGEYFLLAIAVSFPLYVYGLHGILLVLVAGLFCIAFACGDEYHQSFVSGRAAALKDVGIDSFGILVGVIIVRIIGWTGRMTIFRPRRKEADYPYSIPGEMDSMPEVSRREQKAMRKQMKKMQKLQKKQKKQLTTAHASDTANTRESYPTYYNPTYYNRSNANGSYPPMPPEPEPPEHSSDELSEDMPLAHLLKPRS